LNGRKAELKNIKKYLSLYAEPEIQCLPVIEYFPSDAFFVLPIFDEPIDKLQHFLNHKTSKAITMIWVFNTPEWIEGEHESLFLARERTVSAKQYFTQKLAMTAINDSLYSVQMNENIHLYILDRCSPERQIPLKQGVGLARKLGMDLAIKLTCQQWLSSTEQVSWIHSCDADVTLPLSYFDIDEPCEKESVAIYEYQHVAEEGYQQAMDLYEFYLRYYVSQLKHAGSPYAFHTIGSLIAVTPLAYVQVRGIPKRSGAEDFYFLNKLAKVGTVRSLSEPVLLIAGRPSQRVPFGTGPSICKIKAMENPEEEYRYYHPKVFSMLKKLLSVVASVEHSIASYDLFIQRLSFKMESAEVVHVIAVLEALNFKKQYRHLATKKDKASFINAFHVWFDAFVTLRFIHILRDRVFPSITLRNLAKEGINIEYSSRSSSMGV